MIDRELTPKMEPYTAALLAAGLISETSILEAAIRSAPIVDIEQIRKDFE